MKWLLRYLKATQNHGIHYKAASSTPTIPRLSTYFDAAYANSLNKKSYTGIVHLIHGSPVSWTSNKQRVVALSTCEAEYLAASMATQQTNWLRRPLWDLNTPEPSPTPLFIDNRAAILVANNTTPTKRRKFIDIRHHHLHGHIERGLIQPQHVPTQDNLADGFTKPLGLQRFTTLSTALNIVTRPQGSSAAPGTVRQHKHLPLMTTFCQTAQDRLSIRATPGEIDK